MNWRQGETVDVLGKCGVILGAGSLKLKRESLSTVRRINAEDNSFDLIIWMVKIHTVLYFNSPSFPCFLFLVII